MSSACSPPRPALFSIWPCLSPHLYNYVLNLLNRNVVEEQLTQMEKNGPFIMFSAQFATVYTNV